MKRSLNWPGQWSLVTRVMVAAVSLLAVLLATVVVNISRANAERRNAEVTNAYESAQTVAGIVDGFARDLETAMLTTSLVAADPFRPLNQATTGPLLDLLVKQYGLLRTIFVTDLSGRVIVSPASTGLGTDLSTRPYMQALNAGVPEIWAPGVAGIETGEVTATYGRVIADSTGNPRGYLIAAFYPPRLAERLEGRVVADADVVITDHTGFVLFSLRNPGLKAPERDLSKHPLIQTALGGQSVRFDAESGVVNGGDRFGAVVPIPTAGWAVTYSRPVAPLEALLRDRLITQVAQVTLAVLTVALLLVLATRRIARPLERLAGVAESVARGEPQPAVLMEGGPEVTRLSTAMQVMSAAVREREDAIRQESDRRRKLAESSRAFTESIVDLEAETATIARSVAEAMGDGCAVILLSEDEETLLPAAVYHSDPARLTVARNALGTDPILVAGSLVEDVVRNSEPLFQPRVTPDIVDAVRPERTQSVGRMDLSSLACVPLRAQGRVTGLIGVWRDSGEPYLPEDVALLQEIADRAALAIENARLFMAVGSHAIEVERAMVAQDDFLSLVSHDLRNPLTTIKAAAQLVQRRLAAGNSKSDDLLPTVKVIDTAVAKATREIDAILDLSRARAGQALGLQLQRVDLVPLLRQIAHPHLGLGHDIVIQCEEDALEGEWDEARLERAFDNLVVNAVKYSPDGGPVTVTLRSEIVGDERWAAVVVQDEGMGIAQGEIDRVFDRFYRGAKVARRIPGTGLGLSGVKLIVEAHGGTVTVESVEGDGSTFTVRLPCRPAE